tara:strand:+ start:2052 stop:3536 length:1485 start_codon:yes stop_codon:yes gene_type:complete
MKRTYLLFILTCSLSSFFIHSQNIFLQRKYWKENPPIDKIESDIKKGNDPTELNKYAFDPICYALLEKSDNKSIIHLLNKKGNDVNKKTHDSRTYLFWAAYKNNLEIMKYLVSRGAKTDLVDSHGNTVINFAAANGQLNKEIYEFCISKGADPSTELNKNGANTLLIISSSLKGDEMIDYFIAKGVDINSIDDNGNGIFNYTAKGGNINQLDLLIRRGVEYKKPNKKNSNAFIFASQGKNSSLKTFKYLESVEINPNITSIEGFTPMHFLPRNYKDPKIYEYFISKGVNVNQVNKNGNTVFNNASIYGNKKLLSFLIDKGAEINISNKKGQNSLMLATKNNTVDVVNFIINNGGNILHEDKEKNSLAHYIIDSYSKENIISFDKKLELFIENKLDLSSRQSNGNSILHEAVNKNNLKLIKKLMLFNIPINIKNNDGYTALHMAAMKAKDLEIISFLLKNGANKIIKTDFDESAYDLASENELLNKNNIDLKILR